MFFVEDEVQQQPITAQSNREGNNSNKILGSNTTQINDH